ncbi:hypothetical protein CHGG_09553 [Chaetomium globosum CBS 148.51]|uniref:Uncharacterized protein n=1 Tax=Chaetomium globosum (strain ATCC 6205 / CBS 148.51 / DSM 1962 / NBRC 6347 / NRRL 1970) TaxID=306901 RepID=Q2GR51_CHAGB|nr:uncharacterized protein CHGG_09553 [Chaetomium globosum CBS 148.51]EAQ85539.1 hypothetical protein CHGG_09553 [Chaetomium globosum CBS 148.51]
MVFAATTSTRQAILRIQGLISTLVSMRRKSVTKARGVGMTRVWYSSGLAMAARRRDVRARHKRLSWQASQSAHWWPASRNSHVPESRRAKRVVNGGAGTKASAMGRSSSVGRRSRDWQSWLGGSGTGAAGPPRETGDVIGGGQESSAQGAGAPSEPHQRSSQTVVIHAMGCQEEKLEIGRGKTAAWALQPALFGGRSKRVRLWARTPCRLADIAPVWSFLLHALPQILPQCSIGHGNPRPDLGAAVVVRFGPLKVAHSGSGMETGRLPTAAEPGRTQRSRSRFSRCYSFIWFAGWRVGRQQRGELPNQHQSERRSNPPSEVVVTARTDTRVFVMRKGRHAGGQKGTKHQASRCRSRRRQ